MREAVFFTAYARIGAAEDLSYFVPLELIKEPLSPRGAMDVDIGLALLRSSARLLEVHPGSRVEAFAWDAEDAPKTFYVSKVHWLVPGGDVPRVLRELDDRLEASREAVIDDSAQIAKLWEEIAVEEVLEYLAVALDDHNLPFTPGDTTRLVIASTLEHFSVAQVFGFVWRAAKDAAAFQARGHARQHAANTVTGSIQRQADRARSEGWNVKPFRRDRRCPQSEVSRVFSSLVLHADDGVLHMRRADRRFVPPSKSEPQEPESPESEPVE
jgi:hypothetical protein